MKNVFKVICSLLIVIAISSFTNNPDKKIIVIDAGHGGHDSGSVSNLLKEKDVVLEIPQLIKSLNDNPNVEIILTRDSDSFTPLSDRVDYINSLNPDLVVSLHLNSHRKATMNGVELYVSDVNENVNKSKWWASKIKDYLSKERKVADTEISNAIILKKTNCPAVIVELGFTSNENDREYLLSKDNQQVLANLIYQSIQE